MKRTLFSTRKKNAKKVCSVNDQGTMDRPPDSGPLVQQSPAAGVEGARRATGTPAAGPIGDLLTVLLEIRALGGLLICSDLASDERQDWSSIGQAGRMIVSKSEDALALCDEVIR